MIIQKTALLILDEPTEGIAPGIVKDAFSVIRTIKEQGDSAILHVERGVKATLAFRPDLRPGRREDRLTRHAAGARGPGGHQEGAHGGIMAACRYDAMPGEKRAK